MRREWPSTPKNVKWEPGPRISLTPRGEWSRKVCPKGWITAHDAKQILRVNRSFMLLTCRALVARWGKDDPCAPKKYFIRGSRYPRNSFWILPQATLWFLVGRKTALRYGEVILRGKLETRRHRMPSKLKKFLLHHDLRSRTSGIHLSVSSRMSATGSPLWLQKLRKTKS